MQGVTNVRRGRRNRHRRSRSRSRSHSAAPASSAPSSRRPTNSNVIHISLETFEHVSGILEIGMLGQKAKWIPQAVTRTKDWDAIQQRVVLRAPPRSLDSSDEDDSRSVAAYIFNTIKFPSESISWLARILHRETGCSDRSDSVLIQLRPDVPIPFALSRLNRDGHGSISTYLRWLIWTTSKRHSRLPQFVCVSPFTRARRSEQETLQCAKMCMGIHDPREVEMIIQQAREDALVEDERTTTAAATSVVQLIHPAHEHGSNTKSETTTAPVAIAAASTELSSSLASSSSPPSSSTHQGAMLHTYRTFYELGSVTFSPELQLDSIVLTEPKYYLPETTQLEHQIAVPTGKLFQQQYRNEFELTGQLNLASRMADIKSCIDEFRRHGYLTHDDSLQMAYRRGKEEEYSLLLHFYDPEHRKRVLARFEAAAEEKRKAVGTIVKVEGVVSNGD